jgi:hypothetical protein
MLHTLKYRLSWYLPFPPLSLRFVHVRTSNPFDLYMFGLQISTRYGIGPQAERMSMFKARLKQRLPQWINYPLLCNACRHLYEPVDFEQVSIERFLSVSGTVVNQG